MFVELFSHLCNQSRCFVVDGAPLPICQRCFGLYAGAALTAMLVLLVPAMRRGWPPTAVILLHIAGLLTAMVGGLHWVDPSPAFRMLCGLLTGHVAILWLVAAAAELRAVEPRALASGVSAGNTSPQPLARDLRDQPARARGATGGSGDPLAYAQGSMALGYVVPFVLPLVAWAFTHVHAGWWAWSALALAGLVALGLAAAHALGAAVAFFLR